MKKGISLIVLVITIIVMIILAAAIIISISNSNVINKANKAVTESDLANVKNAASLKYGDAKFNKVSEYTTASYIETKLIEDGVIEEANPYVFTNQGGAFLIPEYDVTSNTKTDYRVINNQLYYFGTDINKRITLKSYENVNTEYITIGFTFPPQATPKLSVLTGYDKISSTKSLLKNVSDNATVTANTAISTGTELYSASNEKIATVIYYADLDGDSTPEESEGYVISQIGNYNAELMLQSCYSNYAQSSRISYEEYLKIMDIFLDVDLNGKVDYIDNNIHRDCITMATVYPGPNSRAMKNMLGVYEQLEEIFPYVEEEWTEYGGYAEYQNYVSSVNSDNAEKAKKNAYVDATYDVNMLVSSLPIRVKIFK